MQNVLAVVAFAALMVALSWWVSYQRHHATPRSRRQRL